jgi:hypothetical protein
MRGPTLVPKNTTTIHVVLNDFGKLGCSYVETDEAKADEWTVVSNIAKGEYSNPVRVTLTAHRGNAQARATTVPTSHSAGGICCELMAELG